MHKKRKIAIAIVSTTILLTIAFIWSNSLKPSSQSRETSAGVYGGVQGFLDVIFGKGTISHGIFRKFAHIFEFFVLGVQFVIFFTLIYHFKAKNIIWIFASCILVAIIDESLQNISKRMPSITDVLIDAIGIILAVGISYAFGYLIKRYKIKRK